MTVGSASIFFHASPVDQAGAKSAPIAIRRIWLVRWTVVGPEPKPISATDFSGTEPPLEVGTGRFSSVARSRRRFSDSDTVIGTWRSASENLALFCSMSPRVAMRIVWLSAAVVTPRSAARSKRGLMTDLGPDQVALDARRAQLGERRHFLGDLVRRRDQQFGIVAAEVQA